MVQWEGWSMDAAEAAFTRFSARAEMLLVPRPPSILAGPYVNQQ